MSVMEPLRVGVIGVGVMGERHVEAFQRLPGAQIAAVMDVNGERARQVGERYQVPAFDALEDVLTGVELDALCVCTPDRLHREPVVAALQCGLHVLVEKPLATTIEDADAMIAAAEQGGRVLMVGHILRFDPRYAQARALVAAGEIGRLTTLYGRRHNQVSSALRFRGATTVVDFLGVHDLDMMLWCADSRVIWVQAVGAQGTLADLGIDDGVFALLQFESGAVGCLDVQWAMPPSALGLDAQLKLIGTQGQIVVDGSLAAAQVATAGGLRGEDTVYAPGSPWTAGALMAQNAHFLDCIRTGRTPLTDARSAREAVRVVEAIHRSLATGESAPV